jgi:hypothetical protein
MSQTKEPEKTAVAPKAPKLSPVMIAVLIAGLILGCGMCAVVAYTLTRTETIKGTVQEVKWERSVPIEAFVPVTYSDWQDQNPSGNNAGCCDDRLRSVESEHIPNSVEVCGTPYQVDTGTGYGDVVQDCEYQVYEPFCSYSVNEWKQVDTATISGEGFNAAWPSPDLTNGQRLGQNSTESYVIVFTADGETYAYQIHDFNQFQDYPIGSTWDINVNKLGNVVSVEK